MPRLLLLQLAVSHRRIVRRLDDVDDRAGVQRARRNRQERNRGIARIGRARSQRAGCTRSGDGQREEILARRRRGEQQRARDRAVAQGAGQGAVVSNRHRRTGLRPRARDARLRHRERIRRVVAQRHVSRDVVVDIAAGERLLGAERARTGRGRIVEAAAKLHARCERPARCGGRDNAEHLRQNETAQRIQAGNIVLRIDKRSCLAGNGRARPDPLQTVAGGRGRTGLRAGQTRQLLTAQSRR